MREKFKVGVNGLGSGICGNRFVIYVLNVVLDELISLIERRELDGIMDMGLLYKIQESAKVIKNLKPL